MITLHGERGFEKVDSWDDILSIPGFTEKLDPKKYELKEIIGRYIFKEKISCGLSTCRQPHSKGYLVTTKSGQVTNIGNMCGKTHFGIEFQELSRIFDRAITEHNNREAIASFLFRLESNLDLLETLRKNNKGADWVYKTSRALFQRGRGVPDTVVVKISDMVRRRNGVITMPRIASESEIKDLEIIQRRTIERPYYIEEEKGNLKGIEVLYEENDLREIIAKDLESNLKNISDINIDGASYKDLQFWAKWCGEFDNKIENIEKIIGYGKVFLSAENLKQLLIAIEDKDDLKEFKNWLSKNIE